MLKITGSTLCLLATPEPRLRLVFSEENSNLPKGTAPHTLLHVEDFPPMIQHPNGLLIHEPTRLLLGFKQSATKEQVKTLLTNTGFSLDQPVVVLDEVEQSATNKRAKGVQSAPAYRVNHTNRRFWVHSETGNAIDQQTMNALVNSLHSHLSWIGGVYRWPVTTGIRGLLCPLPRVLLIKPKAGVKDEQLNKQLGIYHLRHIPEISQHLAGYRYFVLESGLGGNVYLVPDQLLKQANTTVQEAHFDFTPFVLPEGTAFLEACRLDCTQSIPTGRSDPYLLDCSQWNLMNIRAVGLSGQGGWEISTGSENVVIAVIDTDGCELDHPDLKDGYSPRGADLPGATFDFDVVINDPTASAIQPGGGTVGAPHGTQCAGILAARINGQGIAGLAGSCLVLPLRPIVYDIAPVAAALNYAAQHGARVISMSFGGDATTCDSMGNCDYLNHPVISQSIQNAYTTYNVVLCAATMNSNQPTIYYPAAHPLVMACGASNCQDKRCDQDDWGAYGSNYGEPLSVVAPGVGIPTTTVGWNYIRNFWGTSAATPHVAGLAALLISVNSRLTNQEIREIIETTADKVNPDRYDYYANPEKPGWNEQMGFGRINVRRALEMARLSSIEDTRPPTAPNNLRIN